MFKVFCERECVCVLPFDNRLGHVKWGGSMNSAGVNEEQCRRWFLVWRLVSSDAVDVVMSSLPPSFLEVTTLFA